MPASATNYAIDSDPTQTTRQIWTERLVSALAPADADPSWKDMWTKSQALMKALFDHPAMESNRQQTFSTPANSKNTIYFMWDFVGRTLWYIDRTPINLDLQRMNPADRDRWSDINSRTAMATGLILDEEPGMLDMMIQQTYPGQQGPQPQMSDEILNAARALKQHMEASCRG